MSDKMNEAIKDIAIRHGVVLSKDDPVLIFQTMNEKLLEENRQAQQEMLAQFKEEMENISSQWKIDATEKAEKVLNVALSSSKEILRQVSSESAQVMKKLMSDSLTEARALTQKTRKINRFSLLSSAAMLTVSCAFMLFFLINFLW